MTELISVIQKQDPGSALIELYDLEINDTDTVYFHPGIDLSVGSPPYIQFDGNTYIPLPAEITGIEHNSDGASNRPSFTVANLLNTFSSLLFDYFASPALRLRNEDLIGRSITKRVTLYRYLDNQPGSSSPVIEFPKRRFIIDRISQETKDAVTFELAAPYDLAGINLPSRSVVGKYCGWQYQGESVDSGCTWATNSVIRYADGSGGVKSHKAYFTSDDTPIIPDQGSPVGSPSFSGTHYTYTVWNSTTPYAAGAYVEYGNTVWKAVKANTGALPHNRSTTWIRGDACGKKLSSCKCRFQFKPADPTSTNSLPAENNSVSPATLDLNTTKVLPFGAFPGSRKFR